MRIAALYDIHANLPALHAVLEEILRVGIDQVVVGGDVVPGPMPRETLACLRAVELPIDFIRGNGELAVLAERAGRESGVPAAYRANVGWNARQLDDADAAWLERWPKTFQLEVDSLGTVLFCHATPRDENDIFIATTPDDLVLPAFADVDASLVVCGHTHMQFDRKIGSCRVVNAGSVGMPFGSPGAHWLLISGGDREFRHTSYDLVAAADRIRNSGYPGAEEFAACNVLQPPTEADMTSLFAKAPIRSAH